MSDIEVLIPTSYANDGQRNRVTKWISDRWWSAHGLIPMHARHIGSWSKGQAVNGYIEAMGAEIIIVADADSFVDDQHLKQAIEIARADGWAMPHSHVKRLSQAATELILAGGASKALERASYPALPGGGIVIARKDAWDAVNGLDPRFVGWGGEDHALGLALSTLVHPVNKRRAAPLWHMWHPPAKDCRKPSQTARDLDARYMAARKDPAAMAALVREW